MRRTFFISLVLTQLAVLSVPVVEWLLHVLPSPSGVSMDWGMVIMMGTFGTAAVVGAGSFVAAIVTGSIAVTRRQLHPVWIALLLCITATTIGLALGGLIVMASPGRGLPA